MSKLGRDKAQTGKANRHRKALPRKAQAPRAQSLPNPTAVGQGAASQGIVTQGSSRIGPRSSPQGTVAPCRKRAPSQFEQRPCQANQHRNISVTTSCTRSQPRRAQSQDGAVALRQGSVKAGHSLNLAQPQSEKAQPGQSIVSQVVVSQVVSNSIMTRQQSRTPAAPSRRRAQSQLRTTVSSEGDRRTGRSQARRRQTGRSHDTAQSGTVAVSHSRRRARSQSGKAFSSKALGKGRGCARVAATHSRGRTRRSPSKAQYGGATGGSPAYGQGAGEQVAVEQGYTRAGLQSATIVVMQSTSKQGTIEPGNRRPTHRNVGGEAGSHCSSL